MCKEFPNLMQDEFEISMIEELRFSLGFQIKQHIDGIFIGQEKYVKIFLKRSK